MLRESVAYLRQTDCIIAASCNDAFPARTIADSAAIDGQKIMFFFMLQIQEKGNKYNVSVVSWNF